ncbi:MAG: TIM barrel protein [candidate division NC10 bacterium]|nr:TIM barrel protein [candidate division NC10 bacterium]
MKRMSVLITLFLCVALLGSSALAADKIVLKKYPDLKMGFLNVNFIKQWPLGVESAKKVIDFANEQGFWWIEIRDPYATLTLAQDKELAVYAKQRDIEVAYAMNIGLLDPNFMEVFSRGLANAAVFDGPRTIRTAGPGLEFGNDPKKTFWTYLEIRRAISVANQAANMAKALGLQYVVENGVEPIKGDGMGYYGTVELFAGVNSNVGFQLDTGNFFCVSRVWTKPADAQAFIEKYAARMGYMHLKTSSPNHMVQQVLADNELDFDIIFAIASKAKMPYVGFELDQPATLEQAIENHKKSVEYLKGKFGG